MHNTGIDAVNPSLLDTSSQALLEDYLALHAPFEPKPDDNPDAAELNAGTDKGECDIISFSRDRYLIDLISQRCKCGSWGFGNCCREGASKNESARQKAKAKDCPPAQGEQR